MANLRQLPPSTTALRDALLPPFIGGLIYLSVWCIVGYCAREIAFRLPELEVWRALISAQGVFWAALLWLSRADLVWAVRKRGAIAYFLVVLLALVMSTLGPRIFSSLVSVFPDFTLLSPGVTWFALVFTTIGALVAAGLAMIIGAGFLELRTTQPSFEQLTALRTRFRRCSTSLSVVLVVAVTSTSWLSKAMEKIATGGYPREIVFSYGIYLTTLLLLVYLPASAEFYRAAVWLADETLPMKEFDKDLAEARKAFLEELGITAGDAFQGALATLGPIVTAVVAVALGKE